MQDNKKIIKRSMLLGYCMGVRKAVESAIKAAKENPNSNVFTLGHLIHNASTLEKLKRLGIEVLKEEEIDTYRLQKKDIVIIRAHGVPPQIIAKLKAKGVFIIDCTCSKVVANRHLAQKCGKKGIVFLAGDKKHPELISIQGYVLAQTKATCIIIQNAKEAKELEVREANIPAFLIAQTTIKEEEFNLIRDILAKRLKNLKVFNTICSETLQRQKALKDLIKEVSSIIIIGDKSSANTQRLFDTSQKTGIPSFFIENATELKDEMKIFDSIGLASGASTPDDIIDQIEDNLCK